MKNSKTIQVQIGRIAMAVLFSLLTFTSAFALTENNRFSLDNTIKKMSEPRATFKSIWIDYDVSEKGRKGMRIHVKFSVTGMKGVDSYLAIYFLDENGDKLLDSNGSYNSADGEVAVYFPMKPGYPTTDYNDLAVFMPYSELDLEDGSYRLRLDVDVIYKRGGLIDHLTFKDIDYDQGG